MEVLSDFGLRENTAVLFVSDHGDMMGDHDLYHKTVEYEDSARVPFLVRLPGERTVLPRVDEVVELRDIMPTVLDIAGVPIPAGVDGVSVLPLMEGAQVPWRSEIHGEHVAELFGNESMHWVTDGRSKFIWFSGLGMEQFFDLDGDPTESRNVVNQPDWAEESPIGGTGSWRISMAERRGTSATADSSRAGRSRLSCHGSGLSWAELSGLRPQSSRVPSWTRTFLRVICLPRWGRRPAPKTPRGWVDRACRIPTA